MPFSFIQLYLKYRICSDPSRSDAKALIATVTGSNLATDVISAKIVWKKLSTNQLSSDLVVAARLTVPARPGTINVNAFLPWDLYLLRRLVLTKSKNKKYNFITYMTGGCIYVKIKGKKPSTAI